MADEKKPAEASELSRRKLLSRVALGGAAISINLLPAQWVKPVVETIVVPAHAQVSGPSPSAFMPSPSVSPIIGLSLSISSTPTL